MSANEYVTIDGVRYAAIALAGTTDSAGNPAGNMVVADRPTNPPDKVIYHTITNDQSAATPVLINDTEGYSQMWISVTIAGGSTSRVGVQADLSSDQSGIYSGDIGFTDATAGTAISSFDTAKTGYIANLNASALSVYASTTGAGETATITIMLKGGS